MEDTNLHVAVGIDQSFSDKREQLLQRDLRRLQAQTEIIPQQQNITYKQQENIPGSNIPRTIKLGQSDKKLPRKSKQRRIRSLAEEPEGEGKGLTDCEERTGAVVVLEHDWSGAAEKLDDLGLVKDLLRPLPLLLRLHHHRLDFLLVSPAESLALPLHQLNRTAERDRNNKK